MVRVHSRRFAALVALALLIPLPVGAHEKWFVDSEPHRLQLDRLLSAPVFLAVLLAAGGVVALLVLRWLVGGDNLFPRIGFLRRFDPAAPVVIAIQTAITLIFMAVNLFVLAPNLGSAGVAGYLLAAAQIFVSFTFISGAWTRIGAVVLLLLVLATGVLFSVESMLEQSIYAGIAIYLLLQGRGLVDPERSERRAFAWERYRPYAPTILRLLAGLSIVVLAFTEKLLNPALGVAFLQEYADFNIARLLGLTWFTDERFVLAAGMVELAMGVALMSGVLPRLVIFAMFVPFNLTIPFLPATELIGHLPVFSVMYVLMFHLPADRLDAGSTAGSFRRREVATGVGATA